MCIRYVFFFFQAEDGIRDSSVTGVQTCALPISFHPAQMGLYDAFNPEARKYYWNLMDQALFKIGVDAWWLDTTEPETEDPEPNILVTNKTFLANAATHPHISPLTTPTPPYPPPTPPP